MMQYFEGRGAPIDLPHNFSINATFFVQIKLHRVNNTLVCGSQDPEEGSLFEDGSLKNGNIWHEFEKMA